MHSTFVRSVGACALATVAILATASAANAGAPSATVTVFATGFNNPRGLAFGPDGFLYVAEGGVGGTGSTAGLCEQVIPPIGPYTGAATGSRVSRVDRHGHRTTYVDGFASSQTSPDSGALVSGASAVAFVGHNLYVLTAGAGCSHGVRTAPNGVYRVGSNRKAVRIADLSAFYQANPVAQPEEDDFEPDGTPYGMVAAHGALYVVEPNHGELDRVTLGGHVSRVVDISASQGHIVPTAIARNDGAFYVGNLHLFPIVNGSSKILRIDKHGGLTVVATGFTTVLGVAFDDRERMYVLENTVCPNNTPCFPTPGTGRVVRVDDGGKTTVIASGLFLPTAMTFGPDGNLYVSNVGFGPPPVGLGEILKIELADDDDD